MPQANKRNTIIAFAVYIVGFLSLAIGTFDLLEQNLEVSLIGIICVLISGTYLIITNQRGALSI